MNKLSELRPYRVTRGMANTLRRLPAKRVCSTCGLSVPVYPGRYPAKCPHCGSIPESGVDVVVNRLLSGKIDPAQALQEIVDVGSQQVGLGGFIRPVNPIAPPEGTGGSKRINIDPDSLPGRMMSKIMLQVNQVGQLDHFIGFDLMDGGQQVKLYFSDRVKNEALKNLLNRLKEFAAAAEIQESDSSEAKWMIVLSSASVASEVPAGGAVGQTVNFTGEVDVQQP